ncbi:DUF4037 domain-containing protein (plasmid) [Rhizobium lusitanum]|uniref:DUF4037 domain-containing protein n=1 Tax=Rhizobium lusitanum TaxID=293958 RepID=UPI00161CBAA4|nr:DUF4037 domain-containing protein [Rhizobium lusitanum]QND46320.1 DUF4037 domain-containing protein [Rhizobium lusitanum]
MNREAELIAAMTPLIADLAEDGNGAVALAGSRGKGRSDAQSDFDFRVYADAYRGPELRQTSSWRRFEEAMRDWQAKGTRMDGIWMRRYAGVQQDLDTWLAGIAVPKNFEWTIWGYHLPTDLSSQQIIADPRGLLAGWKRQLTQYPEALRASVLDQYMDILRYWAKDYHYESKVARRDLVFLVGLTGKLANAILQTVFAFNRAYYPGDGWNLPMAAELERLPPDFLPRMIAILEPGDDPDAWRRQRAQLIRMITDLEALIAA